MLRPGMREDLLTRHTMDAAMTINELKYTLAYRRLLDRAFDGAVKALHMRPDAVRNLLARRPKGWWVDYVRGVRGMEPLDRKKP